MQILCQINWPGGQVTLATSAILNDSTSQFNVKDEND